MIKNLSALQSKAKYPSFAKRLTDALVSNNIEPSPSSFVSAFNKEHNAISLKAHTVRKWLVGQSKPRSASMKLLAEWLKVNVSDFQPLPEVTKTRIEIDFTDQEVITKYLSMNLNQKAVISLFINIILEKAR